MNLSIVIVTYNSAEDVSRCLRSLADNPASCEHEIVVIDNASTDTTRAQVGSFPAVRLIELPENIGYGSAVNRAVPSTHGSHLLLLNPDTTVTAGALDHLLGAFGDDARPIGVVGPRLVLTTGAAQPSARRFPAPARLWAEVLRLHRILPAGCSRDGRLTGFFPQDASGPVDWVSGACHLMPREVFDRAGGLTEATFVGFDDLEYCWRLDRLGYLTWFCADAVVIHECSTSVGSRWSRARVEELAVHNFYVIAADYLPWMKRKLLNAAEIIGALTELAVPQHGGVESLREAGTHRQRVAARLRVLTALLFGWARPITRFEPVDDRPGAAVRG